MTEPAPVYTTATHADIELVQPGYAETFDAYRAAVSAALSLQRALALPPERCAVLTRAERIERQLDKP